MKTCGNPVCLFSVIRCKRSAPLSAVHQNLQRFLTAVGDIARKRDIFAVCGNDVIFCIFRCVLRIAAAMCERIVFDADILCGGNENRTLRNVDEPVIVDIQVFMDAGGILYGIAVVACLEDDRALVGTASDMCAMLDDVVPDLDVLCRTDLPPDADVGCNSSAASDMP